MADSLFPAKRSVKTYSKVRPLQKFDPDPPTSLLNTCGATPILRTGKPFPFIQPANSLAPTLAPANSPSSDTSSSDTPDTEMISIELEKQANTEEEDEKTFAILTPSSKKTGKKPSKKKPSSPLKNISNVIKGTQPSKKAAPIHVTSPFMWTCTRLRPHGQLASIQESDQESLSGDDHDQEGPTGSKVQPKETTSCRKPERIGNPPKGPLHTKMLDNQDIGARSKRLPLHSQKRGKDSPMIVEGRGVCASSYCSTVGDPSSTQMHASQTDLDETSTVTFTRQSGATFDESEMTTDNSYSTSTDTGKEEEFSDIEIPRDFPAPATRVMQQLTPKVANLVLSEASDRKTLRKSTVSTAKAMPKKHLSVLHSRKPVKKNKNSTLVDGRTALNIQEYTPIDQISDIKDDTSRADLDSNKKTSTPSSEGRNTMLHQRLMPDVSSIEGDACAMPTIDVMQSLTSTTLTDKIKTCTTQKLADEQRPVSASSETKGAAPRGVYSISSGSDDGLPTPLNIRGRKAFIMDRASPRMSPRLSFGQFPKAATKMTSNRQKKPSVVSAGNLTRNDSSSSDKHVKFLLSTKTREVLPEPDPNQSLSIVNLPELSPSSSILKKRGKMTAVPKPSAAPKTEDHAKDASKQEKKPTSRTRMTSTPQRHSRRGKGAHMLALSFDVSAVDLPSCSEDDLMAQPSNKTESKTAAEETLQATDKEETLTGAGRSTQELMDFEPIPMQASSASINTKPLHLSQVIQKHTRPTNLELQPSDRAAKQQACAAQRITSHSGAIQHPVPGSTSRCHPEAQQPSVTTSEQDPCKAAGHSVRATNDQHLKSQEARRQEAHQEAQNPVQGTQRPLHGTHDAFSPLGDSHPVTGADDLCGPDECQQPISDPCDVNSQHEAEHPAPRIHELCISQGARHPVYGTQDNTQHPDDGTVEVIGAKEAQHPIHATPKSQLKRSSPNGDLPGRPFKKFLKKDASGNVIETTPQTCDRATQKDLPRQRKRLDYVDKAVGLPECIISRLGPTPYRPDKVNQFIQPVHVMDYDKVKNLPQDIFETIPDAVSS